MAENSKIEWTDHTFNPWWGCVKVSDGCKFCYAETLDGRYNANDPHWGPMRRRKFFSDNHWKDPHKWNREAENSGVRRRVFCASMADVFEELPEGHPDREAMDAARRRLFQTIAATPHLDWQLLTKRPENILPILKRLQEEVEGEFWNFYANWLDGKPPHNVWLGTSVEDQESVARVARVIKVPAVVHFLSCEPLLSSLDLSQYLPRQGVRQPTATSWSVSYYLAECKTCGYVGTSEWFSGDMGLDADSDSYCPKCHSPHTGPIDGLNWIIAGGESGPHARPMHPDWARRIRDQCAAADVPFLFKQWGEWTSEPLTSDGIEHQSALDVEGQRWALSIKKGLFSWLAPNAGLWSCDNAALPRTGLVALKKTGKKNAGRLLDGIEHNGFPEVKP